MNDPKATLAKIQRMVRHCLSQRHAIDTEQVALDIWVEIWESEETDNPKQLCWLQVRNRVIDALRKEAKRHCKSLYHLPRREREQLVVNAPDVWEMNDVVRTLDLLIQQALLSPEEKKLLYMSFYSDLDGPAIVRARGEVATDAKVAIVNRQLKDVILKLRDASRQRVGLAEPCPAEGIR